ncbi:MAG TPA: inorganic diphosphatase [Symbiobacteriaceae bacterium]|nr:inorganic diphosphatase [Symbiobacteriaceae bacterium]
MSELRVETFIEIPAGSQNKYEWDKEKNRLRLDRVLYSPMFYPTDYGFVDETLEEDGDPIDVLLMVTNPTVPGCLVDTRIVGVLAMADDKGVDNKLLGVPVKDPRFKQVNDLADVPPHILKEIEHFFKVYKDLEGKKCDIQGWGDKAKAAEILAKAKANYKG